MLSWITQVGLGPRPLGLLTSEPCSAQLDLRSPCCPSPFAPGHGPCGRPSSWTWTPREACRWAVGWPEEPIAVG